MNENGSDKSGKDETRSPENPPLIDGFELIEQCGRSSSSALWKARQISLGRVVVIKILSEQLSRDPEDVKQFQFEARVAANLKHPGIVQVYDFGRAKQSGLYYFVMEYVTGYSVGDWVRRKKKLSETDALVIGRSVADALGYAWSHARIVHCDIKPDNIMVDGDGTIKVTDLGLARVVRSFGVHQSSEDDSDIVGTPNYMSPEQVMGKKHLDYRADIYSMGASFYHMVTGVLPFGDSETSDVLKKQVNEELEDPGKLAPGLSKGIIDLIRKMMSKNPAFRHQGWSEVANDIAGIQKEFMASDGRPALSEKPDLAPRAGTVPVKKDSDTRKCPHCSKTISKEAEICPSCSKLLQGPAASRKVKLKAGKPSSKTPRPVSKSAGAAIPKARMPGRRKRSSARFLENLRLVASLALIFFLGYYGYKRLVHGTDILHPVRMKLRLEWIPAYRSAMADMRQRVQDYLPAGFSEPESPNGAAPGQAGVPTDSRDPEFLALLLECEEQVPKPGEAVSIRLKGQEKPVEGSLERIGISGVIVRVEQGTIVCPFVVMEEESRLLFMPEERARILMRQRRMEESQEP